MEKLKKIGNSENFFKYSRKTKIVTEEQEFYAKPILFSCITQKIITVDRYFKISPI